MSFIKKIETMKEEYPLDDFAAKCHCIANFMPCPGGGFNGAKGCYGAKDYFPLMIDLIEEWHQWFIDNREKYCLDDYYIVKDGKLKGKCFFEGQSLKSPCPQNKKQVQECINEMLKRIKHRAELIIKKYNDKKENING